MWLFIMLWAPFILLLVLLGKVFADKKDGKVPKWLGAFSGVLFNLVWMSYDAFFKDKFGDGERTMEDEEDSLPLGGKSRQYRADGTSSEKNRLFKDW